jgi:hypothetical protein
MYYLIIMYCIKVHPLAAIFKQEVISQGGFEFIFRLTIPELTKGPLVIRDFLPLKNNCIITDTNTENKIINNRKKQCKRALLGCECMNNPCKNII